MIQPGQPIEHYRIDAVIGDGGMGTVYRATDVNLDRPVAIKVMHGHLAGQPDFQQRFRQEARAAARLEHPSIVRVYHFGRQEGLIYIVMEYVDGLSLGAYLRQLAQLRQVVRLEETLTLAAQAADALGYAHRQGVIHRDVKPDNILVKRLDRPERPGEPPLRAMLSDFGLARLLEADRSTQTGQLMGTLPYMSPEQVLGETVDSRSDLYSLGVVVYQLATGRLPYEIKTPADAFRAHQFGEMPLPREVQPSLPEAVERVILKAMARRPENRFQTGDELSYALRQASGGVTDLEAAAFVAASDSTIVSMVTEFATPTHETPPVEVAPTVVARPAPRPAAVDFVWDIRPARLRDEGICRVLIINRRAAAATFVVTISDPERRLVVDAGVKQVTLAAGQKGLVDFYVSPARKPSIGRKQAVPFQIQVAAPPSGPAPAREGTLEVRPKLPAWLAVLLVLQLITLGALALLAGLNLV